MLASPVRSVRRMLAALAPASRPTGRHRAGQKRLTLRRSGIGMTAAAITTVSVLAFGGLAQADTVTDNVVDNSTGLTLTRGGASASATVTLKVDDNATDPVNGCNVGGNKGSLVIDINTPTGVTATPSQVTVSACDTPSSISFAA